MAEQDTRLVRLFKRISIPRFLVPASILKQMDITLTNAKIAFSPTEWIGIFTILGIVLFTIGTIVFSLLAGVILFVASLVAMVMFPRMQAGKRKGMIEASLPDVLHHMSVSIRSGLVLESVIQEISEAEYGPISEEFGQIMVEMRRGRPLKDALLAFSKRTGSKEIQRAIRLLLEGVESGGPISEVLEEVGEDMRAVRMVQRERRSLTTQQTSFLAMASLLAGPFVMGVVASLPAVMAGMTGGFGGESLIPMGELESVVKALTFYVVAQAVSAAIMMGVVMYGDMKKGFKYAIPMGLIAFGVFLLVKKAMPGMLAMF